MKLAHNCIRIM